MVNDIFVVNFNSAFFFLEIVAKFLFPIPVLSFVTSTAYTSPPSQSFDVQVILFAEATVKRTKSIIFNRFFK